MQTPIQTNCPYEQSTPIFQSGSLNAVSHPQKHCLRLGRLTSPDHTLGRKGRHRAARGLGYGRTRKRSSDLDSF
jgi:hypothetical protein